MKIPNYLKKTINKYEKMGGFSVEYLEKLENPAPNYPMSKPLRDFYIAKGYLDAMYIIWVHKVIKHKTKCRKGK